LLTLIIAIKILKYHIILLSISYNIVALFYKELATYSKNASKFDYSIRDFLVEAQLFPKSKDVLLSSISMILSILTNTLCVTLIAISLVFLGILPKDFLKKKKSEGRGES